MNIKMSITLHQMCGDAVTFQFDDDFDGDFPQGVESVADALAAAVSKYAIEHPMCDWCAAESQRRRETNLLA